MAVKPGVSFSFATDANFGSGPASGNPTKISPASLPQGFIPGIGVNAEGVNFLENINGLWTVWVLAGSTAAGLDAHIVETNGAGQAQVAVSVFGGTASAFAPCTVTSNSAFAAYAGSFSHSGVGPAVIAENTVDGRALKLAQSNDLVTTPGAMEQPVRTTEPNVGASAEGDLLFRGGDYHRPGFRDNNFWRYVHGSAFGFFRAYAEDDTLQSTASGGSLASRLNVTILADDNPVAGATVHLRAICEISTSVAGSIAQIGIVDNTAGNVICTAGDGGPGTKRTIVTRVASALADERYVVIECDYVLPTNAPRIFFLGMISTPADTTYIRFMSIEVTGAW